MRDGNQLNEVMVSLIVLSQQNQMMRIAVMRYVLFEVTSRRDVYLTSDNRMDAVRFHRPVKIKNPVHDAVIRNGAGVHAHGFQLCRQFMDTVCAIKQTVLRM